MKHGSAPKSTILRVRDRLRQHAGAESTLESLVQAGGDRAFILSLLGAQKPSLRQWGEVQEMFLAHPSRLLSLSKLFESTAQDFERHVLRSLSSLLLDPTVDYLRITKEMRLVGKKLRTLTENPKFRRARKLFSYRKMGSRFATVLLCYHVKSKTGRPCFKELAELLSAAGQRTVGEDSLRHLANRAIADLTLNGKAPQLIDAFLSLFTPSKQAIGDANRF
jgi:hypothetical protein